MVPVRTLPGFAATLNTTAPFPVPPAPEVTVTHATLLLAVQAQPLATLTDTDTSAAAAAKTDGLVEFITYTHADPAASASCVTVTLWSPTTTVPRRRSSPGFGAMRIPTVPSPLRATGVVNAIQLASVAAVHEQALAADTAISRPPPAASMARLPGRSSNRQGAACCDSRRRFSLTTISPSRTDGRGLGAARNSTVPEPCPEAGDSPDSQVTLVETSQGHSGDVVTVTVPVPPWSPMLEEEAANAT